MSELVPYGSVESAVFEETTAVVCIEDYAAPVIPVVVHSVLQAYVL